MGRNLIPWVWKTCGHRQADSGKIKPGSETVNNPDSESFRPQNRRSRTQNPKQTRPQPPVERGWADKADSRPPLRGPGGWGGDWYVWHAPDGLRAIAATGLGCVQAGAQKLGVIEASYASAIIGDLAFGICHLAFGIRHLTFGICHLASGICNLAFGICHLACDAPAQPMSSRIGWPPSTTFNGRPRGVVYWVSMLITMDLVMVAIRSMTPTGRSVMSTPSLSVAPTV